jgi:hypothetical protein
MHEEALAVVAFDDPTLHRLAASLVELVQQIRARDARWQAIRRAPGRGAERSQLLGELRRLRSAARRLSALAIEDFGEAALRQACADRVAALPAPPDHPANPEPSWTTSS